MSLKERIFKVTWSTVLQISKGDEIEITRGIVCGDGSIQASVLYNLTNGRHERDSFQEGVLKSTIPQDIKPAIHGIVREIFTNQGTTFNLVEGVGVLEVSFNKLVKELEPFLDKEIVEKSLNKKDAEDIVTNAFRILEERIRTKIGVGPERSGVDLVTDAFNPKTGKLSLGKTPAEKEGLFHIYRGSIGFLRNPPAHRFVENYSDFEVLEIVLHVNFLLNLLDKCAINI